ncbi:hypothetical protein [Vampirovibrio sp.]|uniref:hypothetical protein n=1 Tax=Vampirovibrio sp. TaxID=2717857 RepID=UPI0035943647
MVIRKAAALHPKARTSVKVSAQRNNRDFGAQSDVYFTRLTLARFIPPPMEEKQYDAAVLKQFPVIMVAQKSLKKSSELMRAVFVLALSGEEVDPKALKKIEAYLNGIPESCLLKLSEQTEIFRPIRQWDDIVHNLRSLVGIPGSIASSMGLVPSSEALKSKPRIPLRDLMLEYSRFLLSPTTHQADVAYWDLRILQADLRDRLAVLKQWAEMQK